MTFIAAPETSPRIQALYDEDLADYGYVMNLNRAWAHQPDAHDAALRADRGGRPSRRTCRCASAASSSPPARRRWATPTARSPGAGKLSGEADPALAAARAGRDRRRAHRRRAGDGGLGAAGGGRPERHDRRGRGHPCVRPGFSDAKIFAITTFVALRLAFSTVNDALGAVPDDELRASDPDRGARGRDLGTGGA